MPAAARSTQAVSDLYRQHRARALSIARRILHDPDEAEDVVQEVFIRLCFAEVPFDGKSAYSTWLFRVMVNSSINSLRSQRRRARLRHDPEPGLDPEAAAAGRELRRHFEEALRQISPQHQQVVWLRELRGMSYPEIAALLKIPEGTVKSALNRGRARVQQLLLEEGISP
ncbi:MAG: RNA polymerase sigma factor [Myxococcota bacterium]|nr:RNA polymerase sigma factor [Myxococcota bacterium]